MKRIRGHETKTAKKSVGCGEEVSRKLPLNFRPGLWKFGRVGEEVWWKFGAVFCRHKHTETASESDDLLVVCVTTHPGEERRKQTVMRKYNVPECTTNYPKLAAIAADSKATYRYRHEGKLRQLLKGGSCRRRVANSYHKRLTQLWDKVNPEVQRHLSHCTAKCILSQGDVGKVSGALGTCFSQMQKETYIHT